MIPSNTIIRGHNLLILRTWPDNCVDAVVCDPPYGLSFMGKTWDYDVPGVTAWKGILRVLKPGGYLLSFFGTRTYHRGVCAIENAGFEIRDQIGWAYGSGFPKSLDVGKAIDKQTGIWRGKSGKILSANRSTSACNYARSAKGDPVTDSAKQWDGWGTALKPAWEPIVLARKPLDGTVAHNVQTWGTGALNIDGCRVPTKGADREKHLKEWNRVQSKAAEEGRNAMSGGLMAIDLGAYARNNRWPANLIHDGSEEAVRLFPNTGACRPAKATLLGEKCGSGKQGMFVGSLATTGYADSGSAARFFYCAKASRRERDAGCEQIEKNEPCIYAQDEWSKTHMKSNHQPVHNNHPTVKPLALMRYLCRLVTPPGGLVLDPFCGSGSTCIAALLEGFSYIGIDKDAKFVEIARARIAHWKDHA